MLENFEKGEEKGREGKHTEKSGLCRRAAFCYYY